MKKRKINQLSTGILTLILMGAMTGCVKDLYDPESGVSKLPSKEDYFDFSLTGLVKLNLNYDVPGLTSVIEVYDQNPMLDQKNKKKDINPIFVAYVNDGKYNGEMYIRTAVKEAYVYSKSIATPTCVKLTATAEGFEYDITKQEEATTRAVIGGGTPRPNWVVPYLDRTTFPYEVLSDNRGKRNDNLYSLSAWAASGWECINLSYYQTPQKMGAANEKWGDIVGRFDEYLTAQQRTDGNKSLLRDPEDVNIRIPLNQTGGLGVDITFVGEKASCFNTFGYYYYKDNGKTLSPAGFVQIKKYIIIPNVRCDDGGKAVKTGETVKLLYFDESGKPFEKFPAGYTIGWFVIANGFGDFPPSVGEGGNPNGGRIQQLPVDKYASADLYSKGRYSCMSDDRGANRRFISLYDVKSKLRVIGVEDYVQEKVPDDYMDVMFVAQTTSDLGAGQLPSITDPNKPIEPTNWSVSGVLGFEDIWPNGGDYDLNDVLVEYSRELTIDKDNVVTKVKETFKPVQKPNSANQDNFFACQFDRIGKVTVPAGVIFESATNSIVVEASAKTITGNSYVVERDLAGLGLKQADVQADFNPYIIAKKYATEKRIEVHLPKREMTSAADKTLMTEENAYYVSSGGIYPFAINIPITGFIPTDETKKIDSSGQYPEFKIWATSKGKEEKEWYLKGKGEKQKQNKLHNMSFGNAPQELIKHLGGHYYITETLIFAP